MRISDWSSDVCSSDLNRGIAAPFLSAISSNVRHWRPADGPRWRQSRLHECRLRHHVAAAAPVSHKERHCWRSEARPPPRSEEHTSELQSLMRISYAVFCLKKKKKHS